MPHLKSYILLKIPANLNLHISRVIAILVLPDQTNKIQKKLNLLLLAISKIQY